MARAPLPAGFDLPSLPERPPFALPNAHDAAPHQAYGGRPGPPPPRDGGYDRYDGAAQGQQRRDSYVPGPVDDRRASMGGEYAGGYGGRRSRSPEYDVPPQRDGRPIYREDRDDFRDGSAYPPPPRPSFDDSRGPPRRLSMDPPESLNYLVTQRYFTDFLRATLPQLPADVEAAYAKYKNGFHRRLFQPFFNDMRRQVWFRERYEPSPEMEDQRKALKKRGREGRIEKWLEELESGKLDTLSFDNVKQEELANGNGATSEKDTEMKPDVKAEDDDVKMSDAATAPAGSSPSSQLFIKAISPEISRKDLEAHCAQCAGFEYLALSDPNTLKNFQRVGWVQFASAEQMVEAAKVLCESTIGTFKLHMQPAETIHHAKSKLGPSELGLPVRIAKDLDQIRLVAQALEREVGDVRGSEAIEQRFEAGIEADSSVEGLAALNKKTLDLYLSYLRISFNTCYYCTATHNFPEELERRCPRHLRRSVDEDANRNFSRKNQDGDWIKKLDEKMPLLTNRDSVDPRDFGGDNYDDVLHQVCAPKVKHEEEGKFRCRECLKLFSALKFIEKHLTTKHPEILGNTIDELKFFNNYILDPIHPLAPHEQDPLAAPVRPPLGDSGRSLNDRIGDRLADDRRPAPRGPPPPPPPGAMLDPRARKGANSYADLDGTPAGVADLVLPY